MPEIIAMANKTNYKMAAADKCYKTWRYKCKNKNLNGGGQ